MTGIRYWLCALAATSAMVASSEAQVATLDHTIVDGGLAPAGYEVGCGMAEPTCGSIGLGYAGGFGNCGSCGTGGYMNRNLHQVQPCACGGSPIADFARGVLLMVDKTVSAVLGGIFGGLQTVTCHASGSFAALQCAAMAGGGCSSCGGACDGGCDMGPGCGVGMTSGANYATSSAPMVHESYGAAVPGVPQLAPSMPIESVPMQPMDAVPTQPAPIVAPTDPFIDDPPTPQANLLRSSGQVRQAGYLHQQANNRIGAAVQRAFRSATQPRSFGRSRYLQGRTPGFRR